MKNWCAVCARKSTDLKFYPLFGLRTNFNQNIPISSEKNNSSASAGGIEILNNESVATSNSGDNDPIDETLASGSNLDAECLENTTERCQKQKRTLEKTMIWTELEACKRQVNQIGVSACGATAIVNVLQVIYLSISLFQKFTSVFP